MDTIKTLVQNIILIMVITIFLELLLPSGIMKRYVKLIMGLVVLVSFLQTGFGLLHQNIDLSLPSATNLPGNMETKQILAAGQQLAGQNQSEALRKYKEGLERQITAVAALNGQFSVTSVQAIIQDKPQNKDYGHLLEINMRGSTRSKNPENNAKAVNPLVEPVDIQIGKKVPDVIKEEGTTTNEVSPKTEQIKKIQETVASFYNMSPKQVKINYLE